MIFGYAVMPYIEGFIHSISTLIFNISNHYVKSAIYMLNLDSIYSL